MKYEPYPYQAHAERFILEHPSCGLFLEMGLGKTVITLSAVKKLIEDFMVERVLVVAPLRVASTVWAEECRKWDHLRGLRAVKVLGSTAARAAALRQDAEIYIINRENVAWLVRYFTEAHVNFPFDMVVLDELSSFKSASSERFKAMRRVRPAVRRVVGLTGTPAPNGLIDLWSQVYLLDRGERLGQTLGGYRQRYFNEGRRNAQIVFNWVPKPEAEKAIYRRLEDLCISMRAQDYLSLPPCLNRVISVRLPREARQAYDRLERDLILPLRDTVIAAQTAAVVTGKLLQMSGGAVYGEDGAARVVHGAKLDALEDLLEAANGQPVLVYYAFRHDLQRIMERFPKARALSTARDVEDWNAGKVEMMLAHPDSAGHGLNLQAGGHIMVWFGLTWSLEKYQQANARLYRQGQMKPVTIYHLVAEDTMDEQVMKILSGKEKRQDALIEAVKARMGMGGGE